MNKIPSTLLLSLGLLSCGKGQAQAANHGTNPQPLLIVDEASACREAWIQNEDELAANEKHGNPYAMLSEGQQGWRFELSVEDQHFIVVPDQSLSFQIELQSAEDPTSPPKLVTCQVPTSWKALDIDISIASDPIMLNTKKITMINGKPFGSETKGGVYVRYGLIASDPTDVNLAWFVNSPEFAATQVATSLRNQLHMPGVQALRVIKAKDYMASSPSNPMQALAFTVAQEKIEHWALAPENSKQLWPTLRFLPLGHAPAEATVEASWNAAKILDLAVFKVWDVAQQKLAPCAAFANTQSISCRQITDDTFFKTISRAKTLKSELCVHLAWEAGDFAAMLKTEVCVDLLTGLSHVVGTQTFQNKSALGLPTESL